MALRRAKVDPSERRERAAVSRALPAQDRALIEYFAILTGLRVDTNN